MAISLNDITPKTTASDTSLKQRIAKYLIGEIVGYDDEGNMHDPNKLYNPDNVLASVNNAVANNKMTPEEAIAGAKSILKDGQRIAPFYKEGADLENVKLGDWAKLAGTAAIKHPFKTAGLVGLGAGNIGGLMDNDKFGGQLGGLALGGLGASMLAKSNPYLAAMLTLGGGTLGSLFDKLRAQKEQEQAQMQQMQQSQSYRRY